MTAVALVGAAPDGAIVWAHRDKPGGRVRWGSTPADGTVPAAVKSARLITPGEATTAHRAALPAGGDTQARGAAVFALEDDLAVDLERVHAALGPKPAAGEERLVLITDREDLSGWIAAAAAVGITPDAVTPDYLALGDASAPAAVIDAGDRVVAWDGARGLAMDAPLAGAALKALSFPALTRVCADAPDALAPAGGWGADAQIEPALDEPRYLAVLLDAADAPARADLRQGSFAASSMSFQDLTAWRRAAVIAVAAGAAWLAHIGLDARALDAEARDARDAARTLYAQTFPDAARTANPAAQMRRAAATLADGGGAFLVLSALTFDAVGEVDDVRVETMSYNADRAGLAVSVSYASYADIEALRAAVEARGGRLEEGGSRQRGARTVGDLVVTAP